MSEPFIAEIRIFAGNFAPRGWAFCDGQLLPISQNTALFSLLGTTYGGDGKSTFALPDLQGRAPMHPGRGPGLTDRRLGERSGAETVTITEAQMPNHMHGVNVNSGPAASNNAADLFFSRTTSNNVYTNVATSNAPMSGNMLASAGGSQAHNNMQPYLAINFILALVGLYPSRS